MPEEATPAPAPTPEPKRKKSRLLIIIIAVVILAGGAGGYLFLNHGKADAKGKQPVAKVKPSGPATYFTLDPSLVVNFKDERAVRFLQVGVSLMSHDPKAIDAAKAAEPRIRNVLVLLLSSQDYATLSTTKGKLEVQTEALHKVQDVLKSAYGKPGVEALYFTSFVMQ